MQDILRNLANIDLINFCKENDIPANGHQAEGTHVEKDGRGFRYSLVSNTTGQAIATVQFNKSSVPTHYIHERDQ